MRVGSNPSLLLAALALLITPPAIADAQEEDALPARRMLWRIPVQANPSLERELNDQWLARKQPVSQIHAIPAGDWVISPTPWMALAVQLNTGKRIWEFPWHNPEERHLKPAPRPGVGFARQRKLSLAEEGAKRFWDTASVWDHAADDKRLYFLHATSAKSKLPRRVPPIAAPPIAAPPTLELQLVALDLQKEGALRWMVGGTSGGDERLAKANFLGGPWIDGESLFAIVSQSGKLKVVELSAETGRLKSTIELRATDLQHPLALVNVAAGQWGRVFVKSDLIIAFVAPQTCIAFDKKERKLRWYESGRKNRIAALRDSWRNPSPVFADGRVFIAHSSPLAVSSRSLPNGKQQWKKDVKIRGAHLATTPQLVLAIGETRVVAFRHDGRTAWSTALPAATCGRGYYASAHYYQPLKSGEVVKLSLDRGKLVDSVRLPTTPGNLTLYRDTVLAQNFDYLTAYPLAAAFEVKLKQRLERRPNDGVARARLALHYADRGRNEVALDTLSKLKLDQATAITVSAVAECLAALLPAEERARAMAGRIESRVSDPVLRARLLISLAIAHEESDELEQATRFYLAAADIAVGEEMITIQGRSTRVDRLIQAALGRILGNPPPQ